MSKHKREIVGIGLDTYGHNRITTRPNCNLAVGTQDTHEKMTEKVISIKEKLQRRGKTLDEVEPRKFDDIAQSAGLRRGEKPSQQS